MSLLERALAFALEKHAGALRKLDNAPYILHPMETALIASTMTSDAEVLAAAALHDTVEDTDATTEEIERSFGRRVAALVLSETENKRPDVPKAESWLVRKEESLAELGRTDDIGVKMLWLSDKLSNMRCIARAWRTQGDAVFMNFNQKEPAMHAWYYRSIRSLLSDLREHDAWKELDALITEVFGKDDPDEV